VLVGFINRVGRKLVLYDQSSSTYHSSRVGRRGFIMCGLNFSKALCFADGEARNTIETARQFPLSMTPFSRPPLEILQEQWRGEIHAAAAGAVRMGTKAELPDRRNDHKLIAVGSSRCFQVEQPAPRAKPLIPTLCPRQHDRIGALPGSSLATSNGRAWPAASITCGLRVTCCGRPRAAALAALAMASASSRAIVRLFLAPGLRPAPARPPPSGVTEIVCRCTDALAHRRGLLSLNEKIGVVDKDHAIHRPHLPKRSPFCDARSSMRNWSVFMRAPPAPPP
jgi:hypothetical protein